MSDQNKQTEKIDVYQIITNRIIELLEAGTVPWRKPWTERGLPRNAITKRPYRGVNMMLLNTYDFEHNLFLTWKQIKTIGGSVKKGEKGTFVIFTKWTEKDVINDGKVEIKKKSMLRYYKVFNIGQCKDIPVEFHPNENDGAQPIVECSSIIEGMKEIPNVVHKKPEAFYLPSEDYINMPKMKTFDSSEAYYGTLFHELIHWTGHGTRLNRKGITEPTKFGSELYSEEELIAETGSCYLKSYAGLPIEDMSQNAAYIDNWLSVFKGDKRMLIKAASRGQQAVEYILNRQEDESKEEVNESIGESVVC